MDLWMPGAVRKERVRGHRPRQGGAPPRIVLHTTETRSLPGYRNGKSAPHFTVGVGHVESIPKLAPGSVRVWQHFPLNRTARALRGAPKPAETNHMGSHCIQIEMITYVGDTTNRPGNRGRLPAPLVEAVAGVVRFIVGQIPQIDLDGHPPPERWRSVGAYGERAPQRFSSSEWRRFNGICGHQHVPFNTHWDPGGFDIETLVELVKGNGVTSARAERLGSWPHVIRHDDRCEQVRVIRAVLQGLGYGELGKSDLFTAKLDKAVRAFQASEAITVDGIWGPETHRHAEGRIELALDRRLGGSGLSG